jgi:hypothetical protein
MVSALEVASTVTDPELPMLTLADLGVLRDVRETSSGVVGTDSVVVVSAGEAGAVPAVRVRGHRVAVGVQRHGVPGAAAVPGL